MDLRDVVLEHPNWIAASLLVWFPVIAWIVVLVNGMIMDEIDTLAGVIGVIAALALGAVGTKPPNPAWSPIILAATLSTFFLVPAARGALRRREIAALEFEKIERAYELLSESPNNFAGLTRLSKVLYNRGLIHNAAGLLERAFTQADPKHFPDEAAILKRCKSSPQARTAIPCYKCGLVNAAGDYYCGKCGAPYLLDFARGWLGSGLMHKLVLASGIAMLAIAVLPWISANGSPTLVLVTIPIIFALIGYTLWQVFKKASTN